MSVKAVTIVSIVPSLISFSSSLSVSIPWTVPGPPGRGAPLVPVVVSTAISEFYPHKGPPGKPFREYDPPGDLRGRAGDRAGPGRNPSGGCRGNRRRRRT